MPKQAAAVKAPESTTLSVRLPVSLVERYQVVSARRGMKRNALLVDALNLYAAVLEAGFTVAVDPRAAEYPQA